MKAKTVNAIICKKFDEWAASIESRSVRDLVNDNTIITGGCIASMLLGEAVNDFDVYFRNRHTALRVAKYYVEQFKKNPPKRFTDGRTVEISIDEDATDRVKIIVKSAGIAGENSTKPYRYFEQGAPPSPTDVEPHEYVAEAAAIADAATEWEGKPYRAVFLSSNAVTLSHQMQIILRFYGEPDVIHENFDFVHCSNYWDSGSRTLTLKPAALQALLARELVYVGSKYPLCSIIRTRKFINRGFLINAGQYLKMAMQLNELNLTDPKVLEDQLVGVDFAYFAEIMEKLNDRDPEKVNAAYLVEIIDRMF